MLFHLHCRLVPKWLTLCNTCFNFISTTTKEERKHNFEKLLNQKFGPAPSKNDEKARLNAEYETLLVNVATIQEKLKLKSSEAVWYELLTDTQYYKNCE